MVKSGGALEFILILGKMLLLNEWELAIIENRIRMKVYENEKGTKN